MSVSETSSFKQPQRSVDVLLLIEGGDLLTATTGVLKSALSLGNFV